MENLTFRIYKNVDQKNEALFQKRLKSCEIGLGKINPLPMCRLNLKLESINVPLCVLIERIG